MKQIQQYGFFKTKYGDELLIDIVSLKDIKRYLESSNPVHSLKYYDITLLTDGSGKFCIDGQTYIVKYGDVVFSAPSQIREWDIYNIADGYALIFDEEFLLSFFNDQAFIQNLSYFSALKPTGKLTLERDEILHIINLIQQIRREIDSYQKKDKHILRALLYQILKFLDRIYISQNPSSEQIYAKNRYVEMFLNLIDSEPPINQNIGYYAEKLCITPNYLNELVKAATGSNAKKLLQNKILGDAQKKLLYTSDSVSEIASMLNFESVSYFIRIFKKKTGFTPLQYRNRNNP